MAPLSWSSCKSCRAWVWPGSAHSIARLQHCAACFPVIRCLTPAACPTACMPRGARTGEGQRTVVPLSWSSCKSCRACVWPGSALSFVSLLHCAACFPVKRRLTPAACPTTCMRAGPASLAWLDLATPSVPILLRTRWRSWAILSVSGPRPGRCSRSGTAKGLHGMKDAGVSAKAGSADADGS